MKKILIVAILLACGTASAFSQADALPRLAIMPFYGGEVGEGDTVATLFSNELARIGGFSVVPRTAALDALIAEHDFQLTGLTDSDTIAGIGHMLNADLVLSGSIRQLGNRRLLVATVVNVETLEQVAGYYQLYLTIGEIQGVLPHIARTLADDTLRVLAAADRASLAVVPFSRLPGIDPQDADTLTQLLTIYLLNTGHYAILPRTSTIQSAMAEQEFQLLGLTTDEEMVALGQAVNADYVLSGSISRLGGVSVFTAQILRVADGSVSIGTSRNYGVISDGIYLMEEIAILLTDPVNAEERIAVLNLDEGRAERRRFLEQEQRREAAELRQAEAAERRRQRADRRAERAEIRRERMGPVGDFFADEERMARSVRNEVEQLSLFIAWEAGADDPRRGVGSSVVPILLPSGIYWSPVPYTSIGFETRLVGLDGESYRSVAPSLGLVLSLGSRAKMFSNFLFEMGQLQGTGLITDNMTPGFDIGFAFDPGIHRLDFAFINLKYRAVFFRGQSTHSIGIGASLTFNAISELFGMIRN